MSVLTLYINNAYQWGLEGLNPIIMKILTLCNCFLVLFLLLGFGQYVQGAVNETHTVSAGNLGTILGSTKNTVTNLILKGEINGNDIGVLRSMAKLSVLDLADVKIVEGGSFVVGGLTITTLTNKIPSKMFFCINTIKTVVLPKFATSIGTFAFHDCIGLSSVSIGQYVISIGQTAFCGCINLKQFIVSTMNTTFCAVDGVLFNKRMDKLIHFPNAISSSYIVPSSVTGIEGHAFCGGNVLTSITIPASVISIGEDAFYGCTSLKEIKCKEVIPPFIFSKSFYNVDTLTCKLCVPKGTIAAYKVAKVWSAFFNIVEEFQTSQLDLDINRATLYSEFKSIVIKGVKPGETISVYTISGSIIHNVRATDEEIRIPVSANQIYLVKIGGKIFKIAI